MIFMKFHAGNRQRKPNRKTNPLTIILSSNPSAVRKLPSTL